VEESKVEEKGGEGQDGLKEARNVMRLGRVVSMAWSLGVSISSSMMKRVNKPFVRMQLKIAHGSGEIKTYFLTMTILQFQKFRKELKTTLDLMEDLE